MYSKIISWRKLIVLAFLPFMAGCIGTKTTLAPSQTPQANFSISPDTIILKLKLLDGKTIEINYQEIQALPQVSQILDDKEERGIRLIDLLHQYGVTNFSSITLAGNGQSIELANDQITEEVLLAYSKNIYLKLASPQIPKDQWIRTVLRIEVH